MLQVLFNSLKRSTLIESLVQQRIESLVEKFPDLKGQKMVLTVKMENSPFKAGKDQFVLQLRVLGGKYRGLVLKRVGVTFYEALGDLSDHLLERINRFGDKTRSRKLKTARRFKFSEKTSFEPPDPIY